MSHTDDSRSGRRRTSASGVFRWARVFAPSFLVLVAACGVDHPQSTISPTTDFAHIIQGLYVDIFWWTVLIGALVWILLGYIIIRFREKPGAEKPVQNHGNLGLEIGWTIGPALIVVAIAIPTIQAVFATQEPQAQPDGEQPLLVDVIGHQFWWEFRYPGSGVVTANELHLPVGRRINLRLHSADVIHSFWVPQLGGKRDANPLVQTPEGKEPRYNWLRFTTEETGVYMGQCAEFCGPSHSLMGMRVVVEAPEDFQAWQQKWLSPSYSAAQLPVDTTENEPTPTGPSAAERAEAQSRQGPGTPQEQLIARGRHVFFSESYCVLCHAINGTQAAGNIGPNLTNFGARSTLAAGRLENTPENVALWVTNPGAVKPGAHMPAAQSPAPREGGGVWQPTGLDPDQIQAVAAYLSSLGRGE